ncbi:hypothetical protein [Chenggangzhangella methanolivorans]|uniref:Uncharacterized protein n=1 Tax=Chenggangzhangella methanolivorans TaxID=1437009 RepID=A0A9E6UKK0_9HYPH|nr:hypothetical protein [Chenggangzhangella methanolivorans]QZN99416.1 hypothetical protein K6K41_22120 [Chenggangzhangella methanolivorans]
MSAERTGADKTGRGPAHEVDLLAPWAAIDRPRRGRHGGARTPDRRRA